METQLPSYRQATSKKDWLELVAAHVSIHDYKNLCLVNKQFHATFAPRLFRSPLDMAGQLTVVSEPDRGECSCNDCVFTSAHLFPLYTFVYMIYL